MAIVDTVRAWKDVDYRLSLDAQQRALVPGHPAGEIELLEVELEDSFMYQILVTSRDPSCDPF